MPNLKLTGDNAAPCSPQSLLKHKDSFGRTHFRPDGQTSLRAKRFEKIQLRILKGYVNFPAPADRIAAALVCFEGIATRENLELALAACATPYRWGAHVCIEWLHSDQRQDRRFLSQLSIAHLSELPEEFSWRDSKKAIKNAASLLYPSAKDPVSTFIGDAQAWLFENIPGALLGHLIGTNLLTALPKSALVRQCSAQALIQTSSEVSHQDSDTALGLAFEFYFQEGNLSSGGWLIDKLISITRRNERLSEHDDKTRMITECLFLSHQLAKTDKISSLILAWVIDLVESGTTAEHNLDPGTIEKYVRTAAPLLRLGFLGKDIEALDAKQFSEIYELAKESVSKGQQRTLASALSSWHKFLMQWLNVPPLRKSLHAGTETLPRANVIWPHEFTCIRQDWLKNTQLDERLLCQLRVAFSIAENVRIRATEMFQLRLRNVSLKTTPLEVEICPMLRDGTPKTPSARRVVYISDQQAIQEITDWKIRRINEGALEVDLLFGDPHKPNRVFHLGKFYVAINQILRAVSGDRDVSLHTLSHTWISRKIHDALLAGTKANINRLDQIAVEAGHMTVETSLKHYFHRFEFPLRHHLDQALKQLPLTSADAARLTAIRADALRQRTHASGLNKLDIYWGAILSLNVPLSIRDVNHGIATIAPSVPKLLQAPQNPKFLTVLNTLTDLADGISDSAVASRADQPLEWVEKVAISAIRTLAECHVIKLPSAKRLTPIVAMTMLQSINCDRKTGIDFRRINQEKYSSALTELQKTTPNAEFAELLDAWRESHKGGFVSLASLEVVRPIFAFLHRAGIRAEQLAISIAAENPEAPEIEVLEKEAEIKAAFQSSFLVPPLFDWKKPRRGRPDCYLMWSSTDLDEKSKVASAATSIAGFNSMMLSACVFLDTYSHKSNHAVTSTEFCNSGTQP